MDTEPRTEKLYRLVSVVCILCALGATGVVCMRQILSPRPFSLAKPDLWGALCCGLIGLGLVFRSFDSYTQGKTNESPKLPVYRRPLMLLAAGVFALCVSGFLAYSSFKVPGY